MNRVIILIVCTALISFTACKEKPKSEQDEEQVTIEMAEEDDVSSDQVRNEVSGDCDDFMDDYEAWMEKYLAVLAKYKEDPMSLATSPEYTEMSMEMMNWSSKWRELAIDCANNPEYEKRFDEIQKKVDKEMEALDMN